MWVGVGFGWGCVNGVRERACDTLVLVVLFGNKSFGYNNSLTTRDDPPKSMRAHPGETLRASLYRTRLAYACQCQSNVRVLEFSDVYSSIIMYLYKNSTAYIAANEGFNYIINY